MPGRVPRLCWLPLQRYPVPVGAVLGGIVLGYRDGVWVDLESGEPWPGDPFTGYLGAVELVPASQVGGRCDSDPELPY